MNNSPLHSNDDLARDIDRHNQGEQVESDDPLLAQLQNYKSATILPKGKAETWDRISEQIAPKTATPPLRLLPSRLIGIAAAFAIAAIASWFWLGQGISQHTEFIALAGSGNSDVTLEDGTKVVLRQNSRLTQLGDHNFHLDGEAYFEVTHNPDRIFTVEGNQGRIEVLGTKFNADTRQGKLRGYLIEGSIRMVSSSNNILLDPGNAALVSDGVAQVIDGSKESEYLDWKLGYLELSQTKIEEAIAELSHHHDIQIETESSWQNETISGSLSLEDLETSLNDLGLVLDGRFESQGNSTYRFIAN